MADEAFVEQDRPQVVVAAEDDAVHVVALALHERRRAVERAERVDDRLVGADPRLQADAHLVRRRVEVVDDLEAERVGGPVDGGDVEQDVEAELVAQAAHGRHELARRSTRTRLPCESVAGPAAGTSSRLQRVEVARRCHGQNVSVTTGWRERAILSCSCMIPSITISGRGGQPGT